MSIPVLIITYKRFDFVLQILNNLKKSEIKNVYLSIDNYRNGFGDFDKVESFLKDNDFKYQMLKWETNVGCDHNVIEGIKWFFSHEERGIILEDDCLPVTDLRDFLGYIERENIRHKNISLFSNNIQNSAQFSLRPSFIPVFWGWYSNRTLFSRFYEFYNSSSINFKAIFKIFKAPFNLKIKIILLINYYSHRAKVKGVCWDSELLCYQVIEQDPFIVPSHSYIENLGFGGHNFSHTSETPHWYKSVRKMDDALSHSYRMEEHDPAYENLFMNTFYSGYTNNIGKLLFSLMKVYLNYNKGK